MAIEVRGVSKRFGDTIALDNVNLDIEAGSLTALLGPSGGGKSTLLRTIAGLETPDAGTVHIDGQDMTGVPPKDRGIGFCFQHYAPFRHMTVWENIAFGLKARRRPKDEVKSKVADLLGLVRLEGYAGRFPSELSGGQRQRMALARALAVEPRVLLLDEPFGALDARVRRELRAWLRRLHDEVRVTTVFVTHDQEEAMDVADCLAVVNDGRLEQVGGPTELYDHPTSEFVLGFVGPVTTMGGRPVRPHDVTLYREDCGEGSEAAPAGHAGTVQRVAYLGFEVRVDLLMDDGAAAYVQLERSRARKLGLVPGERVIAVTEPEEGDTAAAATADSALLGLVTG